MYPLWVNDYLQLVMGSLCITLMFRWMPCAIYSSSYACEVTMERSEECQRAIYYEWCVHLWASH